MISKKITKNRKKYTFLDKNRGLVRLCHPTYPLRAKEKKFTKMP